MPGSACFALLAAAAVLNVSGAMVQAQDFPTRPVTLIIPWPAGGTTDVAVRALAKATERHLGQPIVVENRAGAGGTLAPMHMAATEKPDGYTLAQIPLSLLRASLLTKTMFDPTKDLTYVIGLTGYTFGVVVRNDAPWRTFQDLLVNAKARSLPILYGTAGAGTTPHLIMTQIAERHGIHWTHVPFKGSAETTNAILGGHVDAVADGTSWGPLVNAGKLRLLVTWGARRTTNWPTVPTLKEIGINLVANAPYGLAGPRGMNPGTVGILHDAFKKGMEEPSYRATLGKLDQEPLYLNSQDYREFAIRQIDEEKRLLGAIGMLQK